MVASQTSYKKNEGLTSALHVCGPTAHQNFSGYRNLLNNKKMLWPTELQKFWKASKRINGIITQDPLVRQRWTKTTPSIKTGEIVRVVQDNTTRGLWPIGRIIWNKSTEDNQTQVYIVKTREKLVTKPAIRIAPVCPDYCNDSTNEDSQQCEPHPTPSLRPTAIADNFYRLLKTLSKRFSFINRNRPTFFSNFILQLQIQAESYMPIWQLTTNLDNFNFNNYKYFIMFLYGTAYNENLCGKMEKKTWLLEIKICAYRIARG